MAGFGPSPAIVEGESTLIPGAAPLTISGTTYSLAPSGTAVIVNGSPSPLPPVYAVSGKSPTPFIVSGQTVAPGSPAVIIAGTTYSLAPSGTAVIINGSPSPLPAHAASGDRPAPFIVGGETLTPGSPAVTIAGTTYSLAPSGTAVYINDSPSPLPAPAGNPSPFVIGGETVVPGSAVTVSGTTYSLATSGAAIVVNGVTSSLPATTAPVAHGSAVPTELVIGSQTLTPGAAITVSGDVISLPSTGTSEIVVDGDTETLAASTGGGVAFTVSGGAVVTGTFILPAASTSAGVGNGTVGAGGGYTGSAFVNGARGKSVPRWNSGSVLLGVIAAGQLVVGVIM
ncbi:MAG: hypothetical protein L6R39_002544 [Caloplaca ligustica]|nr:MAG: hypothetical protein L6R39_002544 [Caloplaca ligustica]